MKYIETSPEVYAVIRARHYADMGVYSSYSNPTGDCPIGRGHPEMVTEWGFKNGDGPILKARTTWQRGEKEWERVNEKHEYWLVLQEPSDG